MAKNLGPFPVSAIFQPANGGPNTEGNRITVHWGKIFVDQQKVASCKDPVRCLRISDLQLRLELTSGACDIDCNNEDQADEIISAMEGLNQKKPSSKASQGIVAPFNPRPQVAPRAATSSQHRDIGGDLELLSGNYLPKSAASKGGSGSGGTGMGGRSSSSMAQPAIEPSIGVDRDSFSRDSSSRAMEKATMTPLADPEERASKRSRLDAHCVTVSDDRTPEKSAKERFRPGQQRPMRVTSSVSSVLQVGPRKPVTSAPQSSSAYRGYRSSYTFGLQNLGNTCYLNAVMQALCSLREFVGDLQSLPQTIPDVAKGRLFAGSSEILTRMRNANAGAALGPLSPANLRELVAQSCPMFAGNQQQDAHEFLLEYVNQLHDELLGARRAWLDAQQVAPPSGEEVGVLSTQLHLDSEIHKTLHCIGCKETRDVYERFRDFSLDFPPPSGATATGGSDERCELRSMLAAYFVPELLEAKCEHCAAAAANMNKQMTLAPRVLVLHLKRFVPNLEKQRYDKQHQHVRIPTRFDLKAYLRDAYAGASGEAAAASLGKASLPARPLAAEAREGAAGQPAVVWEVLLEDKEEWTPFDAQESRRIEEAHAADPQGSCELLARGQRYLMNFATNEQINRDTHRCRPIRRWQPPQDALADAAAGGPEYVLRSVVAHDGPSPHAGHYVCYARSETGVWRLYDDSHVQDLPAGQDPAHLLGRRAYILFYVLQGQEARGACAAS